jgi:hypothetical protein
MQLYFYFNRAEISHEKLKRQLGTSQGTLPQHEKIYMLCLICNTEIKDLFEKSLNVVHYDFRSSDFEELHDFVSISA